MLFKSPYLQIVLTAAWTIGSSMMNTAHANDVSPQSVTDLELKIAGQIAPKCDVHWNNKDLDLDLSAPNGHQDFLVSVNCNQLLNVELTSEFGGFKLDTNSAIPAVSGFTGFISYTAEFSVDIQNAKTVTADSQSMRATPRGGSIGVIPYETSGRLRLTWDNQSTPFGGRYRDVIEIRTSSKGR